MSGIHLRDRDDILVRVEGLVVEYPHGPAERIHAVSDVSFDVARGETLGIVGESGCGKSTLAKAVMQLVKPTSGRVEVCGAELTALSGRALRRARARVQMVFQDPISSLNPRRRVREIVAEGVGVMRRAGRAPVPGDEKPAALTRRLVDEVLDAVGLDPDTVGDRRPREFSGGQCQRISVARALVMDPDVLICDEPVSALDVSVQAQILNLLEAMKQRYGLTMVFIAHDMAVVKNVSDRIAVMYLGKLCEIGPSDGLYEQPLHPYTQALVDSIPEPEPGSGIDDRPILSGDTPSPARPPSGCRFRTRCPLATDRCRDEEPAIRELLPGRFAACHHPLAGEP